jgi:predicted ATP-dependent Lon-type protease
LIDADTVNKHPKLLVGGVWCIADLEYRYSDDSRIVPWIIEPDHFPNEDKDLLHVSQLVNNNFGKQFTEYIRYPKELA